MFFNEVARELPDARGTRELEQTVAHHLQCSPSKRALGAPAIRQPALTQAHRLRIPRP
jgi:hypothetical protein